MRASFPRHRPPIRSSTRLSAACSRSGAPTSAPARVIGSATNVTSAISPARAPAVAEALYGRELATSVSALEDFAACPFKFFVGHGLDAHERKRFELDARERGSFQHEVLAAFHRQLVSQGKKWRDLSPAEARVLIRQLGEEQIAAFRDGLLLAS